MVDMNLSEAGKPMLISQRDRIVLIQVLFHKEEKGRQYEGRRARRRVADAVGVRRRVDWDTFSPKDAPDKLTIAIGRKDGDAFKRARKLGDRLAYLTPEALDTLLGAIDRRGDSVDDEDALLDLEEKLRAVKEGKNIESPSLPGVRDPSPDDEFIDADDDDDE